MGTINNALTMYILLKSRKKMSRGEIAKILEISPRQVTRYKEDLQTAGIQIIETTGRYGGYELVGNDYFLEAGFTRKDKAQFEQLLSWLQSEQYVHYQDVELLANKIFGNQLESPTFIGAKTHTHAVSSQTEKDKWDQLSEAKILHQKVEVTYQNVHQEKTTRVIHPYLLVTYQQANYLVGYCETRKEIRHFKLMRMEQVIILEDTFEIDAEFKQKTYLKHAFGIFKDEKIEVKLKIMYPYAQSFKEREWVADEVIDDFPEDKYLLYTAEMEGLTQIKAWIMQMGTSCTVLAPESLREEIIQLHKDCLQNYK
ncbi:MAG: hypothetical protein ATN36_04920 [Epulopiscium sp. Nele67-Bin005]|nr:MAG: hypothetical protein ATN36_04920 [Epulopiscium sp. Nele67-Bin005]